MKTRKLRLVSALLAVAMMLALLPTAAFAADGELPTHGPCGKDGSTVEWKLVGDTLTISGSGAMADYDKNNPQPWANQRGSINKVVIGDNVTSIGDNAFSYCTNLIDADMSNASSLSTIGDHAFSVCTALENVDLSKASSLTTIKTSFSYCLKLKSVKLNEGLVEIGGSAFNSCENLKKIHIPSTVTAIGGYCFEDCYGLEEVTFAAGSQLTTIAERTFYYSGLKKITIPQKVKEIQDSAFSGCSGLESVIFEPGSELTTVAQFAFSGCDNLTIYCSDEDTKVKEALNGKWNTGNISSLTPTVTFEVDGKEFEKQNAKDNNFKAVRPAPGPTQKGYDFAGWYTKDESGKWAEKPFNFDTTVTENITLYARWETALVPITPAVELYPIAVDCGTAYDAEGNPIEKAAAGDVVTIKADETAFDGMTFERWEARKGEVKLENDRAAKTSFIMPAGEVQLEAMYQAAEANDSGWDAATVVTGAVIGTGTAILAYHIGMEVYAEQVLGKGVAVPRTRGEVALLAWQLAGSPAVNVEGEPLSEAAQAERWAVESGLMQPDAEGNFNGTKKMSKWNALRVLDAAKKQV